MKRIGLLYDNISGNTGDTAIGLSVKKILRAMDAEFEELIPGRFNPSEYETIIIGGGHLIRPSPDSFYDKFKIPGRHILNSCGIVGRPRDLQYLGDYRYVTVRSSGDRIKLASLQKEVAVVPCTSMLLDDLPELQILVRPPSLGIQLSPNFLGANEDKFAKWASSLGLNIYYLPITHYNRDFIYLDRLARKTPTSTLLPIVGAREIFTLVGNFDYFISCSLHGAIFAYVHKVPFILSDSEKNRFFMEDRGLQRYMFLGFAELRSRLEMILKERPDYSSLVSEDFKILEAHIEMIRQFLQASHISLSARVHANEEDEIDQSDSQMNQILSQQASLSADLRPEQMGIPRIRGQSFKAEFTRTPRKQETLIQSLRFSLGKFFAQRVNQILPDGTRRGQFRRIAISTLKTARTRGVRILLREILEKLTERT
jgi:hypothetical protein